MLEICFSVVLAQFSFRFFQIFLRDIIGQWMDGFSTIEWAASGSTWKLLETTPIPRIAMDYHGLSWMILMSNKKLPFWSMSQFFEPSAWEKRAIWKGFTRGKDLAPSPSRWWSLLAPKNEQKLVVNLAAENAPQIFSTSANMGRWGEIPEVGDALTMFGRKTCHCKGT